MKDSINPITEKKIKVALHSLYAAVAITVIKLLAAYFSGSLAVLSEVFNSGIDIFVCLVTIISIKYSSRPPDEDHNYGHEKVENFSALFQVFILFITSAYIIYEAMQRLFSDRTVEVKISVWIFLALIVSMIIDFYRARILKKTARETKSNALEADALHFSSDILSSFVVIIGLLLVYLNISKAADTIAALVVTGIIIYLGYKLSKKAIDSLMDRVPAGLYEKVKYETLLIKGVENIKSYRIRSSGSKIYIDMTIFISRLVPFSKAHDIMDGVERKIHELIENADVVIHSEPVETNSETINDKIRMIVNDYGMKCHDIYSHKIDNEIYSELHIEIDNTNDLTKAHNTVTEIEERIKKDIDVISHIKIHIDEPSEIVFDTRDITQTSNEIVSKVKNILSECSDVISSDEIHVISTNGKIRVSMNCVFNNIHSLDEVHDIVTVLESKIYLGLKENYPKLSNVIIHAEPSHI
ncbi:MAG: cation diffusion facilitator family transporter [bacterium]|nr:cation diffusion facilitator family transporter [bacterium]